MSRIFDVLLFRRENLKGRKQTTAMFLHPVFKFRSLTKFEGLLCYKALSKQDIDSLTKIFLFFIKFVFVTFIFYA